MYAQVEKPKENKSRAVGNSVAQKKSSVKQRFGFVDNRPEAIAQRKLQETTENSRRAPQVMQLQIMTNNHSNKLGNHIIQRVVRFDASDNPKEARITEAWFPRPEGTSSSGAHSTAISLFQQAAMNAVLYHNYDDALRNLKELVLSIVELPGYGQNEEVLRQGMVELLDYISGCIESSYMNWGANLDEIARRYILLREKVAYTHHETGEGASGTRGEGHALDRLHYQVQRLSYGEKVSEREIVENVMIMLDLRNVLKNSKDRHFDWEHKVYSYLLQHKISIEQTYPILRQTNLWHFIIAEASQILCVDAERMYKVLGKMQVYPVRSEEDIRAELEERFEIGHADGTNNECLLNTVVQLLGLNGVWIGHNAANQDAIHQFLVEADIINDGDMIDVYNINVTQAIAAQYNVQFQIHQVTDNGAILDHPVIGAGGPVLHILHRGAHFTPLFPH